MIFLVSFLIILLLVASYVIYNLHTKYLRLESVAIENHDFILAIRKRVMSQRSYLKQIDRIGSFEADDEVGFFFKELKKIINDISLYVEDDVEDEYVDGKTNIVSKLTRM